MYEAFSQVLTYVQQGGLVMPPLIAAAFLLWYGLGYRWLTLRRGNVRSTRVLVQRYQDDYDELPRGIVDTAIVRALVLMRSGTHDLRRRLDESFAELEADMDRYSTLTRVVVIVAPLCGLLGTVMGMVETFSALGDMSLFAQTGGVAGGISQALFSTQLGLAVAVPGLIIERILTRRRELLSAELARIKDLLCSQAAGGTA